MTDAERKEGTGINVLNKERKQIDCVEQNNLYLSTVYWPNIALNPDGFAAG